jgi:hypothetical protein
VTRLAVLAALVALALGLAGCGLGSGDGGDADRGVTLTVSRDFGAARLGTVTRQSVPQGETVMRLLQGAFDVTTSYGGGFVQSIDGVSGGRRGGRPVDWFYYVNGIEASVGASQRRVFPGDRIWWDHHPWSAAQRIPAVVGSFPEPFLSGSEGRRLPLRLECASDSARACDEVQERLANAGVKQVARGALGGGQDAEVLRVLVGRWPDVRRDVTARNLERGPGTSGVFARPVDGGRRLQLLDARGRVARTAGAGTGLVAATADGDLPPTWVATGTDAVGVAAAAAAMDESILANRFAVAVEEGRGVPLPVAVGPS